MAVDGRLPDIYGRRRSEGVVKGLIIARKKNLINKSHRVKHSTVFQSASLLYCLGLCFTRALKQTVWESHPLAVVGPCCTEICFLFTNITRRSCIPLERLRNHSFGLARLCRRNKPVRTQQQFATMRFITADLWRMAGY